jgi:hypothetical protein
MSDRAKRNGASKNQYLKVVAEKAATVAAIEKVAEPKRDEFLIATSAVRSLGRELAAAGLTVRGEPNVSYARALRREAAAREAFEAVAAALSSARGELTTAQRDAAEWDRRETFWAEQRAAEAALTPEERQRRAIRAAIEADRALSR